MPIDDENALARPCETQHLPGDVLDEVGIGCRLGKERNVTLETGAHGLERSDLRVERARPGDQSGSRFEAVAALDRVIAEVGGEAETDEEPALAATRTTEAMTWG